MNIIARNLLCVLNTCLLMTITPVVGCKKKEADSAPSQKRTKKSAKAAATGPQLPPDDYAQAENAIRNNSQDFLESADDSGTETDDATKKTEEMARHNLEAPPGAIGNVLGSNELPQIAAGLQGVGTTSDSGTDTNTDTDTDLESSTSGGGGSSGFGQAHSALLSVGLIVFAAGALAFADAVGIVRNNKTYSGRALERISGERIKTTDFSGTSGNAKMRASAGRAIGGLAAMLGGVIILSTIAALAPGQLAEGTADIEDGSRATILMRKNEAIGCQVQVIRKYDCNLEVNKNIERCQLCSYLDSEPKQQACYTEYRKEMVRNDPASRTCCGPDFQWCKDAHREFKKL